MKLRTKLLIHYLQEIEKEGKWNNSMDILRAVNEDLKEMDLLASAAPSPN